MSMLDIIRCNEHPIERAIALANGAHANQVDKQGKPYILHCLRVMLAGQGETEQIVGCLHDVLEDTSYTSQDLLHLGFSEEIVAAVVAITHTKWQGNTAYYDQVKANALALAVKRHDIDDNCNRLDSITDVAVRHRLTQKYAYARKVLFGEGDE